MYTLRDYQDEMATAIIEGFKIGTPFFAVAATAAGKSLVIAEVAKRLGEPVLVFQPSREILQQNHDKMEAYGLQDVKVYSASMNSKEVGAITLATIGSVKNKAGLFKHFKYAIIDECHQVGVKNSSSMYMKFFRETGITHVAGVTATPYRLENKFANDGQGGMTYTGCTQMINRITRKPFFKQMVYKVEMHDLIERGYLTRPEYHIYDADLSELIVTNNGQGKDYTEESLEKWGDKNLKNLASIADVLDRKHKRVLVFCSSLRQCGRAIELLAAMGITAESVTGKTPKEERRDRIERFQDGRLKWIVNVGTMTTGFDCPALDSVVMLRPTMSLALYVQKVGRAIRLDPQDPRKTAHIYDFSGNAQKFGKAEGIRLHKEDGYKDCLISSDGQRLDNMALFSFDVKKDIFKKKEITLADLLAKV